MNDDGPSEIPPIIPARMVNEFVYCPRFFHLAFSAREYADNDFTIEGYQHHRSVDRRKKVPLDDERPFANATSVELSSDRLGLTARLDVVEVRSGVATPVEVKRGQPRDADHPVWEPERVQLYVQALLLRENGFECDHAEVYFAGTRQRVRVEIAEDAEAKVVALLGRMRVVAQDPMPPPPLVDSPKCPACTLVGICLPDEQNLMRDRSVAPPRRLLPVDSAARPLYVTEPGATVGKDGERAIVRVAGEARATVRLIDVSQLALYGNVQVSSVLMRELFSREIPVAWFSSGGWLSGMAEGLPGKHIELRRSQYTLDEGKAVAIAGRLVEGKILNARVLLRRNGRPGDSTIQKELKRLAIRAPKSQAADELLGVEGLAARQYFSRFESMLKPGDGLGGFDFNGRNRRPPLDPVNALLSFVYSLLVKDCVATLWTIGLDPYFGVYHRPRFGRPALALDLAEEFRPLIADSTVVTVINNGEVVGRDFQRTGVGVALKPDARRTVLQAYERRLDTVVTHPTFGYKVTYRRVIEVQARMLAAVLLGEFDTYRPMVTR